MRVAFDAVVLGSGRGGDETFLRGALAGLALVSTPADRFALYCPADAKLPPELRAPAFVRRPIARGRGMKHFLWELPRAMRAARRTGERDDICVCMTHAPLFERLPIVLWVGDLSFVHAPQYYPASARRRLQLLVPRQARRAAAVVVPSEFSRRDLVATYGLAPENVFTVPCVVEPPPALDADERERIARELSAAGVRGRFFLYLGNLHPRKNVARLVRAFARARERSVTVGDTQLVIAGARWWGEGDEQRAASTLPAGTVVLLGAVDDATRQHLLEHAVALLYPSLFEGFGLPPIEAMASGTPALVGNGTAFPDVAGDAALSVDPLDVDAIAEGIVTLAEDEALRSELHTRGLQRVRQRFTRQQAGMAMRAALEHARR